MIMSPLRERMILDSLGAHGTMWPCASWRFIMVSASLIQKLRINELVNIVRIRISRYRNRIDQIYTRASDGFVTTKMKPFA